MASALQKKKGKKSRASMVQFPSDTADKLDKVVRRGLWEKCKFLVNDDQLLEATEKVMGLIPEIRKQYLTNPDTKDGNIQAFMNEYGEKILKFLNQRRTDAQGGLKKAYLERARQDPKPVMPDIARMQEVILRQNFISGETHTKTGDIITEEYAAQQHELFVWYVDCLLICICDNHRCRG